MHDTTSTSDPDVGDTFGEDPYLRYRRRLGEILGGRRSDPNSTLMSEVIKAIEAFRADRRGRS